MRMNPGRQLRAVNLVIDEIFNNKAHNRTKSDSFSFNKPKNQLTDPLEQLKAVNAAADKHWRNKSSNTFFAKNNMDLCSRKDTLFTNTKDGSIWNFLPESSFPHQKLNFLEAEFEMKIFNPPNIFVYDQSISLKDSITDAMS